jgi:hypothetical protein
MHVHVPATLEVHGQTLDPSYESVPVPGVFLHLPTTAMSRRDIVLSHIEDRKESML